MTAKTAEAREALRLIAEALAQDLMEAPLEEALKEIKETDGAASGRGEALRRKLAALMTSIRKERLTAAKQGYRAEALRARLLQTGGERLPRGALMEKLKQILTRQPELGRKIGFAFRDGETVTDRELETILEDLQELETRAARKSGER